MSGRVVRAVTALVLGIFAVALQAETTAWSPLGPGGGSALTAVHCDNNRTNHLWAGTRTHGLYYSQDGGETWLHRGLDLGNATVTALETEPLEKQHADKKHQPTRDKEPENAAPRNGLRVYAGTAQGLYISHDLGLSWTLCEDTRGAPIGGILINPYNVDEVYAYEGWTTLDDEIEGLLADGVKIDGDRRIWVSDDRGLTFKAIKYERSGGYRRAYSLVIDPEDPANLFLGAHAGVYQSKNSGKSWKRLKDPKATRAGTSAKTREDGCRGIDISPSGQWMVGIFADNEGNFVPSIADTKTMTWVAADEDLPNGGGRGRRGFKNEFSTPRFVPADTGVSIIMGQLSGSRLGLYRGSGEISKPSVKLTWEQICQSPGDEATDKKFEFRMGWTRGPFRVRAIDLAPEGWGSPKILFSTTETLLVGAPNAAGFPYSNNSWTDIATKTVGGEGKRGASSRGLQANDLRDFARDGRYMIAVGHGNGLIESFDGGETWVLATRPFESALAGDAVGILPADKPFAIAHLRSTYGEFAGVNALYAKKLLNRDENDKWVQVGGGRSDVAGFPNDGVTAILAHSSRPNHVMISTVANGIWFTTNFTSILDGEGGKWEHITEGSAIASAEIASLQQDPLERDTFWALASGKKAGLWRGMLDGKKWKWKQVQSFKEGESVGGLAVWRQETARLISLSFTESSKDAVSVHLSRDDGETFVALMSTQKMLDACTAPWCREDKAALGLRVESALGIDNDILVAVADPKLSRGLGVLRIRIDGSAAGKLGNWSGEVGESIHQGRVKKLIRHADEKGMLIYAVLPGGGVATRKLDDFVENKPAEAPPKKD